MWGSRPERLGGGLEEQSWKGETGWLSGPSLGLLLETQKIKGEDVEAIFRPLIRHQLHLTKCHSDPIVQ